VVPGNGDHPYPGGIQSFEELLADGEIVPPLDDVTE